MVEVELTNNTGQRLNRIIFQAGLRSAAELEPVVVEEVPRPFGAGLAPGREVKLRVELTDKEWRQASELGAPDTERGEDQLESLRAEVAVEGIAQGEAEKGFQPFDLAPAEVVEQTEEVEVLGLGEEAVDGLRLLGKP